MKNTVKLIGHYGSDQTHALSAWTSTSRELTEEKENRIPKLLNMLASDGHHTPFEKSMLHFLIDVEQPSHIHILKHRIAVCVNGESARYKELKEDKFYLPPDFPPHISADLERLTKETNVLYHKYLEELTPLLGRKRAKESARFFKMMNSQITLDVSFNFRSFVHFLKLRNSEHAQVEIRYIAQQMLTLVKNIEGEPFKHTLAAFGY